MASIGQPFQPWESLDDALIDAPIRPLVHALNTTGWARTVFSCAGHPEEPLSVAEGRRQAHVDVVTSDPRRWRDFAQRCRRDVPAAVERLSRKDNVVRIRVAEGDLGPIPAWLKPALAGLSPAITRWHYRRLVFEPVPYDAPPDACRQALDTALAAAVMILELARASQVQ
jgi:hypothetical protein